MSVAYRSIGVGDPGEPKEEGDMWITCRMWTPKLPSSTDPRAEAELASPTTLSCNEAQSETYHARDRRDAQTVWDVIISTSVR